MQRSSFSEKGAKELKNLKNIIPFFVHLCPPLYKL